VDAERLANSSRFTGSEAPAFPSNSLADLRPAVMACGHGQPMAEPAVASALAELAERFDEVALPEAGRYVRLPRRT
jgi:hypothetical protein